METTVVAVKWAQHKKIVFLTLEAKNLSDEGRSITLTPEGQLHFEGINKVTSAHYKLDLNLFEDVVVETSKWKVTDYSVQFSISKKNETGPFWPRLTKEKVKLNNVAADWTRWVDEDEADEKKIDYDQEGFSGLPGDYGDEDEDDEEDEEDEEEAGNLDDLENDEKNEEKKDENKEEVKAEEVVKTEEEKKD